MHLGGLSNTLWLSGIRAFYGRNNVILCRGLKSITDREVCCYMISCKNSTNIDTVIDWLIKHSKSKNWASVPVLSLSQLWFWVAQFHFIFLNLSALSNWVIGVWPLSLFTPCGLVIACIMCVHMSKFYWLASMLFAAYWFDFYMWILINWCDFRMPTCLLIVVLNGIMGFAYVVSFVFLRGAGCIFLWNSLCACMAHLLASPAI